MIIIIIIITIIIIMTEEKLTVESTDGPQDVVSWRGRVGHRQADVVLLGHAVFDVGALVVCSQLAVLEGPHGVRYGLARPVHQVPVQVRRVLVQLWVWTEHKTWNKILYTLPDKARSHLAVAVDRAQDMT